MTILLYRYLFINIWRFSKSDRISWRDKVAFVSGQILVANENPETTFAVNDRTANTTVYVSIEIILRFIDKGARPGFSNNTPTKIAAVRLTYLLSIFDAPASSYTSSVMNRYVAFGCRLPSIRGHE